MNKRKGIILAGGSGTRLYPITKSISKHLINIHDKPLIYYPLTTLIEMGISDINIISTREHLPLFKKLLDELSYFGLQLTYTIQDKPNGIAESLILSRSFLGASPCALILGDNIFCGCGINKVLMEANKVNSSTIFGYKVNDPRDFGVPEFSNGKITKIVEKPKIAPSKIAITGLYLYEKNIYEYAETLKPSPRNELEIQDINNILLKREELNYVELCSKSMWFDSGTLESISQANNHIRSMQEQNKKLIGSPHIAALKNGWINNTDFKEIVSSLTGDYFKMVLENSLVEAENGIEPM